MQNVSEVLKKLIFFFFNYKEITTYLGVISVSAGQAES